MNMGFSALRTEWKVRGEAGPKQGLQRRWGRFFSELYSKKMRWNAHFAKKGNPNLAYGRNLSKREWFNILSQEVYLQKLWDHHFWKFKKKARGDSEQPDTALKLPLLYPQGWPITLPVVSSFYSHLNFSVSLWISANNTVIFQSFQGFFVYKWDFKVKKNVNIWLLSTSHANCYVLPP